MLRMAAAPPAAAAVSSSWARSARTAAAMTKRRLFGDAGRRRRWPESVRTAARGGPVVGFGSQRARDEGSSSSAARTRKETGTTAAMAAAAASDNGAGGGGGEVKHIHSNGSTKKVTLLKSEPLYEYMLETMVYPREHECLRELRLLTQKHTYGYMLSPPDTAALLGMLVKLTGARSTIEVGVYTGYSLLAAALAVPPGGRVVAIDVTRDHFDALGGPVLARAGVAHKVDFRHGPAADHLDALLLSSGAGAGEGGEGAFDLAFVDADKGGYAGYHERLLRLVRVGGVIAYDNTLWGGSVALPGGAPLTDFDRVVRGQVRAFNAAVAADTRVEAVMLPVGDGITLCRRVV